MSESSREALLEQQANLKRRIRPRHSDPEDWSGFHSFDLRAAEPERRSCCSQRRSSTPTSNASVHSGNTTRPRASPDVVEGVIERLSHAKVRRSCERLLYRAKWLTFDRIAGQKEPVIARDELSDLPVEIPRVKKPQELAQPSKRRQELDAHRRSIMGAHSISGGASQPTLVSSDVKIPYGMAIDAAIEEFNSSLPEGARDVMFVTREKIAQVKCDGTGKVVAMRILVGPGNARSIPREMLPMRRVLETPDACPEQLDDE